MRSRRKKAMGLATVMVVLLAGFPMAWAEMAPPAKTGQEKQAPADCAGTRGSSLAYKECLAFLEDILVEQVKQALDAALAERAAMDEQDRKQGTGNADRVQWLDHAQQSWETFAEAECSAAFSFIAPGSDASSAALRCRIRLLRDRLDALDNGY